MSEPKILFLDVETSYVHVRTFRLGKSYLSHDQIVDGQKFDIICVCWKWLGEKVVHSADWGLKAQNSDALIERITKEIEKADVVIGHNLDKFDLKQINTQRLLHGKAPIGWPTTEDTLKQFRKHFYFPSNKLDYLAKTLVGGGKDKMAFSDWVDVIERKSATALQKMIKYCKRDVLLLESVYKKLAPFATPRVNRSLIINGSKVGCTACGSTKVIKRGFLVTRGTRRQRVQCQSCGHWAAVSL